MVIVRWAASMAMAVLITFGLFFFMQALIETGEGLDEPLNVVKIVDSTMPEIELEVIEEIDKPELIEEITEVVEEVERQVTISDGPDLNIDRSQVQMDTGLELSNASISATDGDYLPLVAIAPQYPTRAAQRGIQGWCLVSFTVDGLGNVGRRNDRRLSTPEPANIFDRSSQRAAARFKFQPRVVDGKGVEVAGVQYLFRYELED
jgi:protein TonB